jgi:ABC-type multidrug transport system fused ATPase/permease subunit
MLKIVKQYYAIFIVLIVVIALVSSADLLSQLIIKDMIDNKVNGSQEDFKDKLIIIFILIAVYFPISISYGLLKSYIIKKSMTKMKTNYVRKVFSKNINEFQKENNSLYISTLTNDYDQIETNFIEPLLELIYSLINFAAGVVLFVMVNPIILFIALGLIIINLIISILSSKPLNKQNKERSDLFSSYTSYIKEVLSAFHIIKSNNLDDKVRNDYYQKSKQIQHKGYIIDRIKSFVYAIENANFSFTFIGLIFVIGIMSIKGYITFGAAWLIFSSAEKVIWPISNVAEQLPKIFSVKSIFKRIDDSLRNKENYLENESFTGLQNSIAIKNVSFSYDDNIVLKDINIDFKRGGKYLLIGPSGGGKSTILKLLRKYFNPEQGEILIDGICLKDIKKEQYFSHIANIEQNVFIFEDSIKNNLTLYKDYTDEEINVALKKAGLCDYISGLSEGLNTKIYDNGKNVSGGEKSRIAIARGLLNKADIIFLDEAFASLDAQKAKEIEQSILDLNDITVINVSHVIFKEHQCLYDLVVVVKDKTATILDD